MEWTADNIEAACRTLIPGYNPWACGDEFYFDHAEAKRVIEFAHECCTFTNSKWAGQPVILQAWQVAFLCNLLAWKRRDGTRRYRKALLFIAKKAGKTELAAIVANFLLFCDGEPAPEIVSAAGNAEQATRVFNAAAVMVRNEPELSNRAEVLTRTIRHRENGGTYKVINSESRTKHGGNLHAALIDELFVSSAELVDALETSTRARSHPLILFTTTAGDDQETIAGEVHHYATQIRDGIIKDDEFLPVIFEAPKDADPGDPAAWRAAQPNLNITVPESEYAKDFREAQKVPRKMTIFRQFSLNQWVNTARAWLGLEQWKACGRSFDIEQFKGCRAALGIDLSSTVDTTAVVAAIEKDNKVFIWPSIFIPADSTIEGALRRQKKDRAPYIQWVKQGFITATEGSAVDYYVVEKRIHELCALLNVVEIQADGAGQQMLLSRLVGDGYPVQTVRQGYSLSPATKEVERMVITGELVHPNNPAFSFQISSAAIKEDDQLNAWVVKGRSTGRVDAVVSMNMAINALKFAGANTKQNANAAPWVGDVIVI
jgi:phage terminase large subunit-like protein